MTSTVVAMYDDFNHANAAVQELVDNGFSRESISFVANDAEGRYRPAVDNVSDVETSAAAEGAGLGAGIGAVLGGLGGLLVGLGALAIPGIGPVVAAGPLAAALTTLAGAGAGAVAGGVTGGLIGALVDMGVPEETAQYYAEGLRRGAHLVTASVDDTQVDRAVSILNRHNPIDINERATQWRQSGWTGFDETVEPARRDWPASERSMDMSSDYNDYDIYDERFRRHFETSMYAGDTTYTTYQPAYRYGFDLARDNRYMTYNRWEDLEPEAHRYWDEHYPGTWERFKASVRHAWEEVKNAVD